MMMFRMMLQRSILIQLACLALVGLANAAYDFEACSEADCGKMCSNDYCARKSREACAPPLHRRWLCCSCLYVTMYSLCVYSVRYSKYLRSFPLDIILSHIFVHQLADQCAAENCGQECSGYLCARKSREAFVLSLHRRWVCCSCVYFTMYSLRVYSVR